MPAGDDKLWRKFDNMYWDIRYTTMDPYIFPQRSSVFRKIELWPVIWGAQFGMVWALVGMIKPPNITRWQLLEID